MTTSKIIKGVVGGGRYTVTAADGNPNGDEEKALNMAKSAYLAQLSTNYANANPTRVMMVVTLERADGRQIMRESIGAFPDMTPEPEKVVVE